MNTPEEPYIGPERRKDEAPSWGWPSSEEPLDEATEDLLRELDVPVEDCESQTRSETRKLQRRLAVMGVEDPRSLSRRKVREFDSLLFAAYSLEDIHYEVYARRRANDPSRYVSITVDDILSVMPPDDRVITRLQYDQTLAADRFLMTLGMDRNELREVVTDGNHKQKFELRCLARLMKEKRMIGLARDLRKKHKDSTGEANQMGTVTYGHVVYNALGIINTLYREHRDRQPLTNDGTLEHKLEERAFIRTLSFAKPLVGISRPE